MLVVFRVNGGSDMGMGHLMRCLALAAALRRQGKKLLFLCNAQARKTLGRYLPGTPCRIIPQDISSAEDAERCKALLMRLPRVPDWLVVDHYGIGKTWEASMRPMARRIMAIDDIGRAHDCDILLDANVRTTATDAYHGKLPSSCLALLGPRYALLRQGFKQARLSGGRKKSQRIFVCFGGSDPGDMTGRAAMALTDFLPETAGVDIVAGVAYAHKRKLAAVCRKHPGWRLYIDHPKPEALMGKAMLAIGAGGTMTWERCALGLPAIVISIADNQREVCHALAAQGIICYLGHHDQVDKKTLRDSVMTLLEDAPARAAMRAAGRALIDARGTERVIKAMSA
jgi:UDP-2,4-diacetamido-2,4,6-trideoxy-beta-L-altropyranose hydrolase